MAKFISIPREIDAVKCLNREWADNPLVFSDAPEWLQEAIDNETVVPEFGHEDYWYYRIETLEGSMLVGPDDWIIRGVEGELYPCKARIFAKSWQPECICGTMQTGPDSCDLQINPECSLHGQRKSIPVCEEGKEK